MTADDDPTYQGCRQHLSAFSGFDTGRVVGTCTDRSRRNAMGRRVKVTDEALATTTQYLYDGLNPVTLTAGTSATTMLTGLNIDEYFSFANSTGSASLMTDVLGSIIALTDSTGAVYENYYYEPFGGSPPLIGAASASAPLITIPFGFTGREDDDGTVYYYRARYYNSYLRRFLSQDPVDYANGDPNSYAYVHNAPTMWTDPLGFWIGQYPPPPPNYEPTTWAPPQQFPNGKWYLTDPSGTKWVAHPEDPDHWRHWDEQPPGGGGRNRPWPPNSRKPRSNQRQCRPDQSQTDPSGDAPEWQAPISSEPSNNMSIPLVPFDVPWLPPIQIPEIPPVPVPVF